MAGTVVSLLFADDIWTDLVYPLVILREGTAWLVLARVRSSKRSGFVMDNKDNSLWIAAVSLADVAADDEHDAPLLIQVDKPLEYCVFGSLSCPCFCCWEQ